MLGRDAFWDRAKTVATALAAIVAIGGAVSAFWPTIAGVATSTSGALRDANPAVRYGLLALAIVLPIAAFWQLRLLLRKPPVFEVLDCRLRITIHDKGGAAATVRESTEICARVDNAGSFMHRHWTDGTLGAPKIWAQGYASTVRKVEPQGGLTSYAHEFDPPLRRGMKLWQHYQCDYQNPFLAVAEYFEHMPPFGERSLRMEVIFPVDRKPTTAQGVIRVGELRPLIVPLTPGENEDHRPCVSWNVGRSAPGYNYRIEWNW